MSFVINWLCFFINRSGCCRSWKESVQNFHTSSDFTIKQIKSFLLTFFFLNVIRTKVEPEPGWSSPESKSGFYKLKKYLIFHDWLIYDKKYWRMKVYWDQNKNQHQERLGKAIEWYNVFEWRRDMVWLIQK